MKKIRFTTIAMSIVLVLAQLMFIVIPVSANDPAPVTESTAPLFIDDFQFFAPEANATNYVKSSQTQEFEGNHTSYKTDSNLYLGAEVFNTANTIYSDTTAYVTIKLKNNSQTDSVCIGALLYFSATSGNALVWDLAPLVYNATTGKKMDCTTSYGYKSNQVVVNGALPTVEIPANTEVYIAIPFSSVAGDTSSVPGVALAADDTFVAKTMPTKGCLGTRASNRRGELETIVQSNGKIMLRQIQLTIAGNADTVNNTRAYTGDYNFSVSGVYHVTKEEYNAKYNAANFKMVEGAAARLNVKTGMRFAANISNDYYDYLVNTYGEENVSYGTIITPKHYADAAGAMTFAALDNLDTATWGATKYLNVEATAFRKQTATLSQIAGSLVEIKEDHYDWTYSAVSYVKIVKGNEVIYLYAANAQTGMISDIAQKAVNDRSVEEAEGYGNNLNDGHANGNWSPYNTDEIDILKGFYS